MTDSPRSLVYHCTFSNHSNQHKKGFLLSVTSNLICICVASVWKETVSAHSEGNVNAFIRFVSVTVHSLSILYNIMFNNTSYKQI